MAYCLVYFINASKVSKNKAFVILRHVYNMEAKSSSQMGAFFTRCLPIAFTLNNVGQNIHVSEREKLFLPNGSKFAVEHDCNSEISQNVQNLGPFWKNFPKFPTFLKNECQMVLFLKIVFPRYL